MYTVDIFALKECSLDTAQYYSDCRKIGYSINKIRKAGMQCLPNKGDEMWFDSGDEGFSEISVYEWIVWRREFQLTETEDSPNLKVYETRIYIIPRFT